MSTIVEDCAAEGKTNLNKTSDSLKLVRDQNEARELGGGTEVIFAGSDTESTVSEISVEGPSVLNHSTEMVAPTAPPVNISILFKRTPLVKRAVVVVVFADCIKFKRFPLVIDLVSVALRDWNRYL